MRSNKIAAAAALVLTLVMALAVEGCGSQPKSFTDSSGAKFNDADVAFATDMIPHHAQSLEMVDLSGGRTLDPAVEQLAIDIGDAHVPEIETMVDLLEDWERPVPETSRGHSSDHGGGMANEDSDLPGMMSADEMAELEAASEADFQKQWLTMMIAHHKGAIEMATDERKAGESTTATKLAASIQKSQAREIALMNELLDR